MLSSWELNSRALTRRSATSHPATPCSFSFQSTSSWLHSVSLFPAVHSTNWVEYSFFPSVTWSLMVCVRCWALSDVRPVRQSPSYRCKFDPKSVARAGHEIQPVVERNHWQPFSTQDRIDSDLPAWMIQWTFLLQSLVALVYRCSCQRLRTLPSYE